MFSVRQNQVETKFIPYMVFPNGNIDYGSWSYLPIKERPAGLSETKPKEGFKCQSIPVICWKWILSHTRYIHIWRNVLFFCSNIFSAHITKPAFSLRQHNKEYMFLPPFTNSTSYQNGFPKLHVIFQKTEIVVDA